MGNSREHDYGIDALRCIATIFVVTLHTINRGGVLEASDGLNRVVILLVDIIAICAVNCYALVSGYVGYTEKKKNGRYSRWFELWLQIVFYNILFFVVQTIALGRFDGIGGIVRCFLPLTTNEYWYFTAYSVVFFLMPYLNAVVANATKPDLGRLIFILLLIFSVYSTVTSPFNDLFFLNKGYSFCWLSIMYIVGAGIKRYGIPNFIKEHKNIVFISCVLINGLSLIMIEAGCAFAPSKSFVIMSLMNYNSPTVFLCALLLFFLFAETQLSGRKIAAIRLLAPVAFGIYLIQENPFVRENFVSGKFAFLSTNSTFIMIAGLVTAVVGQLVIGFLIEKVRRILFQRGLLRLVIDGFGLCIDAIKDRLNFILDKI